MNRDHDPDDLSATATSPVRLVREFYAATNAETPSHPVLLAHSEGKVMFRLLDEELAELGAALQAGTIVGIADALADLVYVAYGLALKMGIELDQVLNEVHKANMSKVLPGAEPPSVSGKVSRGPGYRPPNIAHVLGLASDEHPTRDGD